MKSTSVPIFILFLCTSGKAFPRPHLLGNITEEDLVNLLDGTTSATAPVTEKFDNCTIVRRPPAPLPDVDTGTIYPGLQLNSSWISKKYFWHSKDFDFQSRYVNHVKSIRANGDILKVFVLPHSHNDPGWLDTYLQYYYRQTKHILNNVVKKLTDLPHMTFVWSETTYLAKWWKEASRDEKERLLDLVKEGRLEIATGGWVVPDEATTSLYALITQLTEGQQWVRNNLNITAQHSWAIDPFGHSATHSHLLKKSGLKGMVIQRLHYAWKHWLAEHKTENFLWRPRWDTSGASDIPCHTLPFDLYSIKHACGPEPQVCLKFDFRRIEFEYGENYGLMTPISRGNVRKLADEIVDQYLKTSSLTKHNVILVPLGDDFRYDRPLEWDQQYANYMQLFMHINGHRDRYRMEIRFGTLSDYFEAVEKRNKNDGRALPTLSGDFFPYGDVYASGQPSYWTGFYGTRPYWKKFHRELENELRSAEIIFTYANALARQAKSFVEIKTLSYLYLDLVSAREEFSVFCHHDGITGTSRRWTMQDYGDRMHTALQKCINLQIQCLKLINKHVMKKTLPPLNKDFIREHFDDIPAKIPLEVFNSDQYTTNLIIFNNLGWQREELIKVVVKNPAVEVSDPSGNTVPLQINPVLIHNERDDTIEISERLFELVFIANLEPLSFSTFKITQVQDDIVNLNNLATVSCKTCMYFNESIFPVDEDLTDTLQLENPQNLLHFRSNGLLERVGMKAENKTVPLSMSYGLYKPINKLSGAYLLKPSLQTQWKFFRIQEHPTPHVIKLSGPIMSQVITVHSTQSETLKVNTTLLNSPNGDLSRKIVVENYVDFSREYTSKMEVFMRFETGLNTAYNLRNHSGFENGTDVNGTRNDSIPVLYTDQNGLVSAKRINSIHAGYEGNTYPVTTMAHIQDDDEKIRFSVLVDRTHGFNSMKNGMLETLIERKNLYDDGRGLSEGVTEVKSSVSRYTLLLEDIGKEQRAFNLSSNETRDTFTNWQPTLYAHTTSLRLNYPPNLFVSNEPTDQAENETTVVATATNINLISSPLPRNVHLVNLRTLSESSYLNHDDFRLDQIAGKEALLNLQHFATFDDEVSTTRRCNNTSEDSWLLNADKMFQSNHLNISRITPTTLTASIDNINAMKSNQNTSVLASYKIHFV